MNGRVEYKQNPEFPKKYDQIPIGAKVKATLRVKEGQKVRNQVFEGILIKKRRGQGTATITLRKMSFGVGVERIIPLDCKNLVDLSPVTFHAVRRSKLYYLRKLTGKSAKLAELYGISQAQLSKRFEDEQAAEAQASADAQSVESPDPETQTDQNSDQNAK